MRYPAIAFLGSAATRRYPLLTTMHIIQEYNKNRPCMCRLSYHHIEDAMFLFFAYHSVYAFTIYLVSWVLKQGFYFLWDDLFIQGIWLEWNKECKSSYFKTHDFYRFRFDMRTWLVNKAIKCKIFFCGMIFYLRDFWLEWNKESKSGYFKTHMICHRFWFDIRTLVNKTVKRQNYKGTWRDTYNRISCRKCVQGSTFIRQKKRG